MHSFLLPTVQPPMVAKGSINSDMLEAGLVVTDKCGGSGSGAVWVVFAGVVVIVTALIPAADSAATNGGKRQ